MKLPALSLIALLFLSCASRLASAQVAGGRDCPIITVSCPDDLSAEKPLVYRANISGGSRWVTPTYKWVASGGRITAGQGTSEVTLDPLWNNHVTVTVEVGGYPASCSASASCSWIVCLVTSRKLDEYGDIGFSDERERLYYFAAELQKDPAARGYILAYAGRRARSGEARKRGERAKGYLHREHGIEARRIVVVDGGHREERTVELYIVPNGAAAPAASPTVEPRDVEVTGAKPRGGQRNVQP